jgi:hypothetical protein
MPARIRRIVLASMVGLTALGSLLCVRHAEALWPLSFSWYCAGDSTTQVRCDFTVTNPGPSGYQYKWLYGDGSQSGRSTSTEDVHYYAMSVGQYDEFDLMLIGYANSSSTSPDNVIGCTILVGNDYGVGGAPPYTGHCP